MLSFQTPKVGCRLTTLYLGIRKNVAINDFILTGFAFHYVVTNTTREGCGKLFVVRTGNDLFARLYTKHPLSQQATGSGFTVSGRFIYNHYSLGRTLVKLLKFFADAFQIRSVLFIEIGGFDFTEHPKVTPCQFHTSLVLNFFVLLFGQPKFFVFFHIYHLPKCFVLFIVEFNRTPLSVFESNNV